MVFPARLMVLTVSGEPIELSTGVAKPRPSMASVGEVDHLSERGQEWRVLRQRGDRSLDDRAGVLQPQQRYGLPEEFERSAVQGLLQVRHRYP